MAAANQCGAGRVGGRAAIRGMTRSQKGRIERADVRMDMIGRISNRGYLVSCLRQLLSTPRHWLHLHLPAVALAAVGLFDVSKATAPSGVADSQYAGGKYLRIYREMYVEKHTK